MLVSFMFVESLRWQGMGPICWRVDGCIHFAHSNVDTVVGRSHLNILSNIISIFPPQEMFSLDMATGVLGLRHTMEKHHLRNTLDQNYGIQNPIMSGIMGCGCALCTIVSENLANNIAPVQKPNVQEIKGFYW